MSIYMSKQVRVRLGVFACVCACECAFVCVCLRVYEHANVCLRVCWGLHVFNLIYKHAF